MKAGPERQEERSQYSLCVEDILSENFPSIFCFWLLLHPDVEEAAKGTEQGNLTHQILALGCVRPS